MFIDDIALKYQMGTDEVLTLLRAYGITPIFDTGFGDYASGYITEKQFQTVKMDLLKLKSHYLQQMFENLTKTNAKKHKKEA